MRPYVLRKINEIHTSERDPDPCVGKEVGTEFRFRSRENSPGNYNNSVHVLSNEKQTC